MSKLRVTLAMGMAILGLMTAHAFAADGAPPRVVPQDPENHNSLPDMRGVPDSVKALVLNFNKARDQYLAQQQTLRSRLHQATTDATRDQLRQQLQANRQQFLADLQSFRQDLRNDLAAMKPKVAGDMQRLINAGQPPHDHHKGH